MKQADFYILPCADQEGKFDFLGKLLGRILSGGHQIYLHCNDQFSTEQVSQALWQYRDSSFLANALSSEKIIAPITIGWGEQAAEHTDVLINYSDNIPATAAKFERVVEIVIQQSDVLALSRKRYKQYQQQGFKIKHNDMRKPPQR
ncbi:MAG: hypothetical protein OFPI_17820 [Osedax symbiont Rs2]|nr:MAG: hypothetical protein OFPI_17820 [Osedax symbiont Rs2]